MYKIANVKVSVKTSPLFLDTVYRSILSQGIDCNNYNNFIVVKSVYTYIIFKTNYKSENHINITKIPSVDNIKDAIEKLLILVPCMVLSQKIDNIIATTNINHKLSLKDIVEKNKFQVTKYNNEKFPGLFLKFQKGTAILFHSGKIVIVGSKSIEDIECLLAHILANIEMRSLMREREL
jgi:TATA-box binding protein (TBP) (component of TFIID and TFIIIB)